MSQVLPRLGMAAVAKEIFIKQWRMPAFFFRPVQFVTADEVSIFFNLSFF